MFTLFLKELGLPTKNIPPEFVQLNEYLFCKWKLLKVLMIRDILEYMMSFIVRLGRDSYYELVDDIFSSFSSRTQIYGNNHVITIEHKVAALIDMCLYVPYFCSDKCCFRFYETKHCLRKGVTGIYINKNGCRMPYSFDSCHEETDIFDKWYSNFLVNSRNGDKSISDYTIMFEFQ